MRFSQIHLRAEESGLDDVELPAARFDHELHDWARQCHQTPCHVALQPAERIHLVAEVARATLDELANIYAHGGAKVAAIETAADMLGRIDQPSRGPAADYAAAVDGLTHVVLEAIGVTVERSTEEICSLFERMITHREPRPGRDGFLNRFLRR
jgi:hypothetical protein